MMLDTTKLISFLKDKGVQVKDRRPASKYPLPNRKGYREHDFRKDCEGICVHHSAGKPLAGGEFDVYANLHLARWSSAGGIAYSIAIDFDGGVTIAWDLAVRTYAQGWEDSIDDPETFGDENVKWKGVLVDGNFRSEWNEAGTSGPTIKQMHSLECIRQAFSTLWGMSEVTTHSEHGKPACPGDALSGWAAAYIPDEDEDEDEDEAVEILSTQSIQKILQILGYSPGPIDGKPGIKTTAAIHAFQKDNGLVADGIAGPITAELLKELC